MTTAYRSSARPPATPRRWGATLWTRLVTFAERDRRRERRRAVLGCWESMGMQSRNDYRNPGPIRCVCGHHAKDCDGRWPYVHPSVGVR